MQFPAVAVVHSSEQIVRGIEEQIRLGNLVRGQRLPTERQLAEQFGVSRGVVREAIKTLDALGLVESRQGSGSYIRHDPAPPISRALTLTVTPEMDAVRSLYEFRAVLEVAAAAAAARHRTEAQRDAIAAAAAETEQAAARADVDNYAAFAAADQQLHVLIGEASANPYLAVVIRAVRQMQRDIAQLVARQHGLMATANTQHAQIVAAITAGDAGAAEAAMREHLRYSAEVLARARAAEGTP